ncbi:MAG: hypothetical protein Q3959_00890 [Limosilactobacillus sp.]|uniref:hypothetical protein n=1 Tax=Limosilactobacillus sp. TaxID=2773925 RepID=UPI0027092EBF|nr:hypothetical protein [Limosilactobacillus sp.]
MKVMNKIVLSTSIAAVLAVLVDAIMFTQHGQALSEPDVWVRLLVFIILAGIVNGLSLVQMRFCGYATIIVNLYFGLTCFAGFTTAFGKMTMIDLLAQALGFIGILAGCAGIYYGVKQRAAYTRARIKKLEERAEK